MPLILILVAAIMVMAAWNNSVGCLFTELETDVPGFVKWFLALAAVGALGWVPGMEKISRMLLGLILLVMVLKNYTQLIAGFQNVSGASSSSSAGATNVDPAQAYIANPNNPSITQAEIAGTGQSGTAIASSSAAGVNINAASGGTVNVTSPFGAFDPNEFLAAFTAGFGGFGGVA